MIVEIRLQNWGMICWGRKGSNCDPPTRPPRLLLLLLTLQLHPPRPHLLFTSSPFPATCHPLRPPYLLFLSPLQSPSPLACCLLSFAQSFWSSYIPPCFFNFAFVKKIVPHPGLYFRVFRSRSDLGRLNPYFPTSQTFYQSSMLPPPSTPPHFHHPSLPPNLRTNQFMSISRGIVGK